MWDVNKAWVTRSPNEQLLWAARQGFADLVRQALHAGASLYVRERGTGNTALHMAMQNGRLGIARMLIEECSFDTDVRNNTNAPPALTAAQFGHFEIVEYLVSLQVSFAVQAFNLNDENIFHEAAARGMPIHLARSLLTSHSDPVSALRQRNSRGLTPAQEAFAHGRFKLMLLFEGHVHGAAAA